jgi:hypothetical protein
VSCKEIAQGLRAAEFLNAIGANLNARKSQRGDVVDRLVVVAAPSDSGVAVVNLAGAGRNRRIEVGEIGRRIEELAGAAAATPVTNSRRRNLRFMRSFLLLLQA